MACREAFNRTQEHLGPKYSIFQACRIWSTPWRRSLWTKCRTESHDPSSMLKAQSSAVVCAPSLGTARAQALLSLREAFEVWSCIDSLIVVLCWGAGFGRLLSCKTLRAHVQVDVDRGNIECPAKQLIST